MLEINQISEKIKENRIGLLSNVENLSKSANSRGFAQALY